MIKEYYDFLKIYLRITQGRVKYFIIMIMSAIGYKTMLILMTFFATQIIKYLMISNHEMTYLSLILFTITIIFYMIFLYINYVIYGYNNFDSYTKLSKKILEKIINVDDSFTKKISKGKLLNSVNSDIFNICDMLDRISELFGTLFQCLVLICVVMAYNIYLGIILIIYAFFYIKIKNNFDRKISFYARRSLSSLDAYTNLFQSVLSGLQEIKTFNIIDKLEIRLNRIKNKYTKDNRKKINYFIYRDIDTKIIGYLVNIIMYTILTILLIRGEIGIDVLILLVGYQTSLTDYIAKLIESTAAIRDVSVSVERVESILNYKDKKPIPFGSLENDYIDGIIEFRNISFSYNNKNILNNFSLKIKPNEITTIVGQTGTGKTTIINLLLRLYKVNKGKILIDNADIYEYTKKIHSSNVSVVNQKPFIFNMSIRKNLNFVDKNIENQIKACKRVGIHDFIMTLPNGYNTILRENATNVSGGQKQLISLARTLLSKSEILLFDEVTSSLDPDSAKVIYKVLYELKKDHTIVVISHKPDMMKKSDRIIVLHNGKIVGDGHHEKLIKNNEHYKWLSAKKSASKVGVFDYV
jgi:ABC-type multidrug transport system, ATPase and permease components